MFGRDGILKVGANCGCGVESPRWLLKKYRIKDSFTSFCRLRNSEVQAARDLVCFYLITYLDGSNANQRVVLCI